MIPPALTAEVERRLRQGAGVREISAELAVPMGDVQEVRDRMVATAAPRDHRLDSLLDAGDASHRPATRRLAARARALIDELRDRVAAETEERRLQAEVDRLSAALGQARAALKAKTKGKM